jgi:hypothetical protein
MTILFNKPDRNKALFDELGDLHAGCTFRFTNKSSSPSRNYKEDDVLLVGKISKGYLDDKGESTRAKVHGKFGCGDGSHKMIINLRTGGVGIYNNENYIQRVDVLVDTVRRKA